MRRAELVAAAAAADADPVTRLVLGWLAAKRSENTRAAYARDIGISPGRRSSRAPSWLAWCRAQGVHPVTGVTGLHVARYARRLEVVGLSPATASRKLAAVSGWYAWLVRAADTAPPWVTLTHAPPAATTATGLPATWSPRTWPTRLPDPGATLGG